MLNSFFYTALWSSLDYYEGNENYNPPLDDKYSIDDITPEFIDKCEKLCNEFMTKAKHLFNEDELCESNIGHNLWLTIERHGAGFWDGDYVNGDELTKIAQSLSSELSQELNENIIRK